LLKCLDFNEISKFACRIQKVHASGAHPIDDGRLDQSDQVEISKIFIVGNY
jgi:hypothetical protein